MKRLALFVLLCAAPTFAQQQSLSISWDASPTPNVGYNVYRGKAAGDCSGASQPNCVKLNALPVSGLTYVDSTIPRIGGNFIYVVRAVDNGSPSLESINSNELAVSLPPIPPAPPSNVRKTT